MSIRRGTGLKGLELQTGISLIELVVFIVVIGVGVTGILSVMSQTSAHSADPLVRKQALAIAESLLEEALAKPYTWCDPDDANLLTASSAAGCAASAEAMGPEAGESRYGPTFFDNINDYDRFTMASGIIGIDQAPIAGLTDYTAQVSAAQVGANYGLAADAAIRLDVTVAGRGETVTLSGYRFRHSPNSGG